MKSSLLISKLFCLVQSFKAQKAVLKYLGGELKRNISFQSLEMSTIGCVVCWGQCQSQRIQRKENSVVDVCGSTASMKFADRFQPMFFNAKWLRGDCVYIKTHWTEKLLLPSFSPSTWINASARGSEERPSTGSGAKRAYHTPNNQTCSTPLCPSLCGQLLWTST